MSSVQHRIDVIVPSYQRPENLRSCLESLSVQTLRPDRVHVVARHGDDATIAVARTFRADLRVDIVMVSRPGQVAALNAALVETTGSDVIAVFDDDVVVEPGWLEGARSAFADDPSLGGVCGRERMVSDGVPITGLTKRSIGTLTWFGRHTGLFHLADGRDRNVDHLKGCAMAYRRLAVEDLRFDERLQGSGAQPFNDTAFSLAVRRRGWSLRYLGTVAVDHIHGSRGDGALPRQSTGTTVDQVHNETITVLDHMSPRHIPAALAWLFGVGSAECPGILQLVRALPSRRLGAFPWFAEALQGRWSGLQSWRTTREVRPR